jgi:hypothetical protein
LGVITAIIWFAMLMLKAILKAFLLKALAADD